MSLFNWSQLNFDAFFYFLLLFFIILFNFGAFFGFLLSVLIILFGSWKVIFQFILFFYINPNSILLISLLSCMLLTFNPSTNCFGSEYCVWLIFVIACSSVSSIKVYPMLFSQTYGIMSLKQLFIWLHIYHF